ncbi:MAG: sulfatase [Flavobacteriaceae bacterium]
MVKKTYKIKGQFLIGRYIRPMGKAGKMYFKINTGTSKPNLLGKMASLVVVLLLGCSRPSLKERPNILIICIDDLRTELNSFGAHHIVSPHMDALAEEGVSFQNHYVNSPSCGPSRYTFLTGQYGPSSNNALFLRAEQMGKGQKVNPSMPEWFREQGYTTVSVGKVSHHPGGRGGTDWNDSAIIEMPRAWDRHLMPVGEWQHPRGMMHGLAHGEIRKRPGDMDILQSVAGNDTIYPDGIIVQKALQELGTLASDKNTPFFLAVGLLKPHLPFGAPKHYLKMYDSVTFPPVANPHRPEGKTTWHPSGEFMKYHRWGKDPNGDTTFAEQVRRHYAACVSYVDAQVGKLLEGLRRAGADENTIIVLWGDHGFNLGEHAIWGKHNLFDEALHSPLVIQYPGMKNSGAKTQALVETVDVFPTLCDLTGIATPEFVHGTSLKTIMEEPAHTGHSALSYNGQAVSLRTQTHRLTLHTDGHVELYDHTTPEGESKNRAVEQPSLVRVLRQQLNAKGQKRQGVPSGQ